MEQTKIIVPDVEYHNKVILKGEVTKPVCVGGSHNATFYMKLKRFSNAYDELQIYTLTQNIKGLKLQKGCFVNVEGEIRTRNITVGSERRLQVSIYANELSQISEEETHSDKFISQSNEVELSGTICKKLPFNQTRTGYAIQEGMIAVNNRERHESYYIPFVSWNKCAEIVQQYFNIGDQVTVKGRMQSREYTKKTGSMNTRTAYELSIHHIGHYDRI